MNFKNMFEINLKQLVLLGLFVAIEIILNQIKFTIIPKQLVVSLGFVGSVLLAYMFGPVWGTIGGGITDLVSSAIFPPQGGFFIGFTLTAMAGPLIYALFFYNKPVKIWRVVVATLLVTIFVNILLNTYWIHLMMGINFKALLITRIPKEIIVPWIQMVITYFVLINIQRVKTQVDLK